MGKCARLGEGAVRGSPQALKGPLCCTPLLQAPAAEVLRFPRRHQGWGLKLGGPPTFADSKP
eukprot:5580000-Alexandrium_andersonii.AAC.1